MSGHQHLCQIRAKGRHYDTSSCKDCHTFCLLWKRASTLFLCLRPLGWKHICFRPVLLSSVCPYATFFSARITIKQMAGLTWNCRNILSTSKKRAELFFPGCGIQDSRLSSMFIWNIYWSITLYWIEILTSIFFVWFQKLPENILSYQKTPKTAENCRKRPEFAKKQPEIATTLYWIKILT